MGENLKKQKGRKKRANSEVKPEKGSGEIGRETRGKIHHLLQPEERPEKVNTRKRVRKHPGQAMRVTEKGREKETEKDRKSRRFYMVITQEQPGRKASLPRMTEKK